MKQQSKCVICQSSKRGVEFKVSRTDAYRPASAPPASYWQCLGCEAMLFDGPWNFEESYSEGAYYGVEGDAQKFLMRRFMQVLELPPEKSDNVARVSRIAEFLERSRVKVGNTPKVLDVGAGMGVFLKVFLDGPGKQWKGVAVEPEPNACAHLQKVLSQVKIVHGFSSDIDEELKFQLVTFNRVLEHIANPQEALKIEQAHLSKQGVLYIEVPDVLSYFEDGPDNEAFGYGHYIVYSPQALEMVAKQAGFEVLEIKRVVEPSGKFTLFGFCKVK